MGDRAAHGVEGGHGIGLRGGELQLALRLGKARAGVDPHTAARDEFARHPELAAGGEQRALVGRARVREALRLVPGAREREVEVGHGILEPVEVRDRIGGVGRLEGVDALERLQDGVGGLRVRGSLDFGARFGRIRREAATAVSERGGGRPEGLGCGVDRVEQPVRLPQLRCCGGEPLGHRVDPRRGDLARHRIRLACGLADETRGTVWMVADCSERRRRETLGQIGDAVSCRGEARSEVRDAAADVLESARGTSLVGAQRTELRILRVEHRLRLLAQRDDLQRPLASLARAVGLRIVKRLPEAERLGETPPRLARRLREGARPVGAELRDRVAHLVVGVAHAIVEAHEQGSRAHREGRQLGVGYRGAGGVASATEEGDEGRDAEERDERDNRADRPEGAREHVHAPSVGAGGDRKLAVDVPGSAASGS